MSRSKPIQISIPKPCREGWDKMTPNERGRFCAHCQKTVIDFTTWPDSALYNFFEKSNGNVCGHFNRSQLEREIIPPYKTPNWWYKMAISMGLTSLLTQVPWANAQQLSTNTVTAPNKDTTTVTNTIKQTGSIAGQITDTANNPLNNILITLQNDSGTSISQTQTNSSGHYMINNIPIGDYDMYIKDISNRNFKILKTVAFIFANHTYTYNTTLFPHDSTSSDTTDALIDGGAFSSSTVVRTVYVWGPFRFSKKPFFFKIIEKLRKGKAKKEH